LFRHARPILEITLGKPTTVTASFFSHHRKGRKIHIGSEKPRSARTPKQENIKGIYPSYSEKDPHIGWHEGRPVIDVFSSKTPTTPARNLECTEGNKLYLIEQLERFMNSGCESVKVIFDPKSRWREFLINKFRVRVCRHKDRKLEGVFWVKPLGD